MQVARNFFLSREKSYLRKVNEIFLALKIEQELTKDEILELYLNKVFLGHRAHGFGAAAQVYYGKNIEELNLPQLAMIAGLPKAPSTTNPVKDPQKAFNRRNYVLGRMLTKQYITQQEYTLASEIPITASLHKPTIEIKAPYVGEMVRSQLIFEYGEDVTSDGYKVFTSIRDKNQAAANIALVDALLEYDQRHGYRGSEHHFKLPEEVNESHWRDILAAYSRIGRLHAAMVTAIDDENQSVTAYINGIGAITIHWQGLQWARKYINENVRGPVPNAPSEILNTGDVIRVMENEDGNWRLAQIPEVEGSLVSVDPNNGATLALVGGFEYQRSKFNRITQAKRQPGSSFKPFIYSAALEEGYTAATIINDSPFVLDDPSIEDTWRPQNSSKKYGGPTRLRKAITKSLNLVSIRLLNKVGVSKALKHVAKFGFDTSQLPHGLSLALGSGVITPWQSARGYSVLANGGYLVEPYFIDRIEDPKGNILFKANPAIVCHECEQLTAEKVSAVPDNEVDLPVNTPDVGGIELPEPESEMPGHYAKRVVDEENVWIMNSLTRDVIQYGTGIQAKKELNRSDLSGKTGTTNDQRDAWFAGYNPSIVTISWVGFDDSRQLGSGEYGGKAALPMWIDYMRVALEDIPEKPIKSLPGLISVRIDPETGKPTSADTPGSFFEVFRPEYAPLQTGIANENVSADTDGSGKQPGQIF